MACLAVLKWVNPDEHTIRLQELRADRVGERLVIDGRLGLNAERRQFLEDAMEAIVARRRLASCGVVPAPDDCDLPGCGRIHATSFNGICLPRRGTRSITGGGRVETGAT